MKLLFIFLFTLNIVNASYDIIDKENIFIVKIKNSNFKTLYVNLKDEINFQSFTIVHELNLSKSTSFVAEALNKNKILKNGTNILICKSSFTLEMIEENIENISYCPMPLTATNMVCPPDTNNATNGKSGGLAPNSGASRCPSI